MIHLSFKILAKMGGEQSVLSSPIKAIRDLPWTSVLGFAGLRWGILPQKDSTGEIVSVQGLFCVEHCWKWLGLLFHLQPFFSFLRAFCETVTLTGMFLPSCCAGSVQTVCMLKSSKRPGMMSNINVFFLFKHIKSAINPHSLSAHL